MKQSRLSTDEQFKRFITQLSKGQGLGERAFTNDLYEYLITQGTFIAHFNKQGFIEARFRGLSNFDHTLDVIRSNKKLKSLLADIHPDTIAMARYQVAASEAQIMHKQALNMIAHVERLQSQFSLALK